MSLTLRQNKDTTTIGHNLQKYKQNKLGCFYLNKFFQASLIFMTEAKSLPIEWGTLRPWATPKY